MKAKWIAQICVLLAIATGILGGAYYVVTKDPTPIRLDLRVYDDYVGYYVFPNGYPVRIQRDGDRLLSTVPEHRPRELFPETPTQFFIKGNRTRWIFHRAEKGDVDYAISRWKTGEGRARRQSTPPTNPEGTNGLIAATTAGKALEAGLAVLKEGGSPADAAIATALCEIVQVGGSYVSFAGPMMMIYYDAATRKVYYLDAEYAMPLEEKEPRSIPGKGGRTALVPGFMAGVQVAHDRFGRIPFERLFAPAIELARNGEKVSEVLEGWIETRKGVLSRYPDTKKLFTRPSGKFLIKGDWFRQPELAETLQHVASEGAAYMYEGKWQEIRRGSTVREADYTRRPEAIPGQLGGTAPKQLSRVHGVYTDGLGRGQHDPSLESPGAGKPQTVRSLLHFATELVFLNGDIRLSGLKEGTADCNSAQQKQCDGNLATDHQSYLAWVAESDANRCGHLIAHRWTNRDRPLGKHGGRQSYDQYDAVGQNRPVCGWRFDLRFRLVPRGGYGESWAGQSSASGYVSLNCLPAGQAVPGIRSDGRWTARQDASDVG
ncbi:MAG TPA: gamma-glutamyltransferase [Candidatus Limnocylindrales bacterium]|jgi:hypothetical protein|nr:gamma-glutamyltransferase [Candidatus Limnocylindrales bacterium]